MAIILHKCMPFHCNLVCGCLDMEMRILSLGVGSAVPAGCDADVPAAWLPVTAASSEAAAALATGGGTSPAQGLMQAVGQCCQQLRVLATSELVLPG